MPFPRASRERCEQAVELVEEQLRQGCVPIGQSGGRSAIQAAAEAATDSGLVAARTSFSGLLASAKDHHGLEPDWSIWRPRAYLRPEPGLPHIPDNSHLIEDQPEGEPIRMMVIGDAHDSPHIRDKSRFRWLGAHCAANGFERVLSVGDWLTLDSFSSHTDRGTFEGLAKPTFAQDLESFHESQRAFQEGLAGHKAKLDITLGNHCLRAARYDNLHPDGVSHALLLEEAFAQWGWRTTPYGQYRFIGGVGCVHVPLNGLGRPMGGVTGGQRAANAAMFDVIHGDSHKSQISVAEKIGPVRAPAIFNAATALPPGYIEGYASKGGSTWRSGVCEAAVWGSHVRRWAFEEMTLLKRRYGRSSDGAATVRGWAA